MEFIRMHMPMLAFTNEKRQLASDLYDIKAVKFGNFETKVGLQTPIYFDLRVMVSYPEIMSRCAKLVWKLSYENPETKDVSQICGVPYTALPLSTLISVDTKLPMLIKRKEAKSYGTKKLIEGVFSPGDTCVIIEDVITSGSSVLETADALRKEGLNVTNVYVIIDREQGGKENIENHGIKVKSLYSITQLMQFLLQAGKIKPEAVKMVEDYLSTNKVPSIPIQVVGDRLKLPYCKRVKLTKNSVGSKLLEIMELKRTNLCLAADLKKSDKILEIANIAGPYIAVLKTHVDIMEDFNESFVVQLKELAKQHKFLLMEDRKFGDIGNTVSLQYRYGLYKIAEWADLITVHAIPGACVIHALKKGLEDITEPRGIFLVAEMSSKDALTEGDYRNTAVSMAEQDTSGLVVGIVCQTNILTQPGLLQLTPGVKLSQNEDALGQQYNNPQSVINAGADLAVVGRGITEATCCLQATLEYKEQLWEAYEKRTNTIGLYPIYNN